MVSTETKEVVMNVMIGVDPHKASHTAVAIGGDEDELAKVKVRATSRQVEQLIELGRAIREAHLGHRVSGRPGLPAGPAARGSRRRRARCAGDPGLADPGAGHRALEQERPQRCPLDRHRRPAGAEASLGRAGRPRRGPASLGQAQRDSAVSGPRWSAGSTALLPSSHQAELPRKCTFPMPKLSLAKLEPQSPVQQIRFDLALELLDDVRRLDAQTKESHRRIRRGHQGLWDVADRDLWGRARSSPPRSSATPATFARFANRDAYASYNGTAPIEFSSGGRIVHRLSTRGQSQAQPCHSTWPPSCQIRHPGTRGRVYFERKVAEGKTKKEALRSLKRQISNAVYRQLLLDAR